MRPLTLQIVTPAPHGSTTGNRVTALRWRRLLARAGHTVSVTTRLQGRPDVLIVLHAQRSADSALAFARERPGAPLLVLCTGTDLYASASERMFDVLRAATRIAVLQPLALNALPAELRAKAQVILQSARAPRRPPPRREDIFEVLVLAHLRAIKDPLRTAYAARLLGAASRVRVTLAGSLLEPEFETLLREELARNTRLEYVGELTPRQARRRLAQARLLVVSSRSEGGPNVISEAAACGTPVLATRVDGNVGLLGEDYPAYFDCGDDQALAALMQRTEQDATFLAALQAHMQALRPKFTPQAESAALDAVLRALVG